MIKTILKKGHDGAGLVVSVLAFSSDRLSSNPIEVYYTKICWQLIAPPSTPDFPGKVGLNLA